MNSEESAEGKKHSQDRTRRGGMGGEIAMVLSSEVTDRKDCG